MFNKRKAILDEVGLSNAKSQICLFADWDLTSNGLVLKKAVTLERSDRLSPTIDPSRATGIDYEGPLTRTPAAAPPGSGGERRSCWRFPGLRGPPPPAYVWPPEPLGSSEGHTHPMVTQIRLMGFVLCT